MKSSLVIAVWWQVGSTLPADTELTNRRDVGIAIFLVIGWDGRPRTVQQSTMLLISNNAANYGSAAQPFKARKTKRKSASLEPLIGHLAFVVQKL